MNKKNKKYIYLQDATKYCDYSQEYLSLRARQGKLKAKKFGRDWLTTKEWIKKYVTETNGYKNGLKKDPVFSSSVKRVKPKAKKQKITSFRNATLVKPISVFSGPPANLPIGEFEYTPIKLTPPSLGLIDKIQGTFALMKKKGSVSREISLRFIPIFTTALILIIVSGVFFESSLASTLKLTKPYIATINNVAEKITDKLNQNEIYATIVSDVSNTQDNLKYGLGYSGGIFQEYKEWIGAQFKSVYNFVVKPWTKAKPIVVQQPEPIKESQPPIVKETIIEREVSKVTRVEPIKEITREVIKIDDGELANIKKQINVFASWEEDIQNLQNITAKLQAGPAFTPTSNAPIYIASQGLQVGGNASFASLGVSGSAGIKDLGVGNSTTLGTNSSDALTVNATSTFNAPVTMNSALTVGSINSSGNLVTAGTITSTGDIDTSGNLTVTGNIVNSGTITSTGNITTSGNLAVTGTSALTGNVTASGDLTIQGDLTVAGAQTYSGAGSFITTSDPQLKAGYDSSNYSAFSIDNAGDLTLTATGGDISFGDENIVTTGTLGAGAVTGTSFTIAGNTLNGTEWGYLDGLDQALNTTTSPTFTAINTGQGAYELYAMDQDVLTSSSPTFAGLTLTNAVTEFSTDGTLADNSDSAVPTEKAVKTYADTKQALDTALTNISALTYVSDSFIKLTADDTYAVRTLAETIGDLSGVATGAFSFNDQNITNVGDISLDSISSDAGTSINVDLGSDAGDDFTVDTNKLVVSGDTGYVGIGTATPTKLLYVNGVVSFKTLYLTEDSDSSFNYGGGSHPETIITGRMGTRFYPIRSITNGNAFSFSNGVQSGLTDTDAEQAWMKLEPEITQTGTANYVGFLMDITENSVGDGTASGFPNSLMDLRITGTSKFVITNAGNVGIGVASPASPLQVSGDVLATSFSIGAHTLDTEWGYLNSLDQALDTTTSPTFAGLTLTNAVTEFSTDGTLADNSDSAVPTEKAVKTYVDTGVASADTLAELTDTTITSISDNELLQYDNGTSKWINQTLTEAGVQALDTALTNISALVYASDSFIKLTADDTYAVRTLAETIGDLSGVAVSAFSFNDQNITNVGDISLDSISSDAGTSINVNLGSDAGDDFTVDTNKLVVEGDTGRVGIGVAAPDGALHVSSGVSGASAHANADDLIVENNGNAGISILSPDNANASLHFGNASDNLSSRIVWNYDGETNGLLIIGTAKSNAEIQFQTSSASVEAIRIDGVGNVGIGTTSPSQELDLIGDLELEDTTSSDTGVIYKGADRFIHNYHDPDGDGVGGPVPLGYNTFVGVNAGNFTMGSTAGATWHSSYNSAMGVQSLQSNTTGGYNSAMGVYSLYSNTTGYNNIALGFQAGRYQNDGTTGLQTPENSMYIGYGTKSGSDPAGGEDAITNEMVFGYNATGLGSNSVVLGNSSIATTALRGNVGIGTTSPSGLLHVAATAAFVVTSAGQVGIGTTSPSVLLDVYGTSNKIRLSQDGTTYTDLQTTTAGFFNINTTGAAISMSDGLSIGSSYAATSPPSNGLIVEGSVGIGTNDPNALLDVYGTIAQLRLSYNGSIYTEFQQNSSSGNLFNINTTGSGITMSDGLSIGSSYASISPPSNGLIVESRVGFGTLEPDRRLDVLDSSDPQMRLTQTDGSEYSDFKVDSAGDLRLTASGGDLKMVNDNIWICSGGSIDTLNCPTIGGLSGQGNLVVENDVFADGYRRASCPAGMIEVPPSPQDGLDGFCVDKYEAKSDTGDAVSEAAGTPWVSIAQYDAREECIRAGKHLITEQEWLAIAHNVEDVGWNWNGGVAGTNQMSDGHSDNDGSGALAADVTGDADDDPCVGTGQGCDTSTWSTQRRTYKLSNGEYIWDFGGNVWEWVDQATYADYPVDNYDGGGARWVACSTSGDGVCGNTITTNDYWHIGDTTALRAFLRGGCWNGGTGSGAFALNLNGAPANTVTYIGFRCAR